MSKHQHPEPKPPCTHGHLSFCQKCDVVECDDCGEEFLKKTPHQKTLDHFEIMKKLQEAQDRSNTSHPWNDKAWPWSQKDKVVVTFDQDRFMTKGHTCAR